MTADLKPCPFKVGDKVRVRSTNPYAGDWKDTVLLVTGVNLKKDGSLNIWVNEDWPNIGDTDGWSPDDLEHVSHTAPHPEAVETMAEGRNRHDLFMEARAACPPQFAEWFVRYIDPQLAAANAEIERLKGELLNARKQWMTDLENDASAYGKVTDEIETLKATMAQMAEALDGMIKEADRNTHAFERARQARDAYRKLTKGEG